MILGPTFVACLPEPAPPAPPPLVEERCPGVDWAVRLDGPIEDIPEHVLPTPDGDVIIAGLTTGSIRVGTGPERLAPGQGFRDGFVARLAPDGRVRWSRVLGGPGIDQVLGIQLHGNTLHIVGSAGVIQEGIDLPEAWVVERLLDWSRAIPEFRASTSEDEWRGGWLLAEARARGLDTPLFRVLRGE